MAGTRERRIAAVLGEEIRVVMARQKINGLQLSKLTGISNSTLATLLNGTAAMDVDQLARICKALGLEPGPFYSYAITKADGTSASTALTHSGDDPRALIQRLLDNPDEDPVLAARLAEAPRHLGGNRVSPQPLAQQIRQGRREELARALASLPPSTERAAGQ